MINSIPSKRHHNNGAKHKNCNCGGSCCSDKKSEASVQVSKPKISRLEFGVTGLEGFKVDKYRSSLDGNPFDVEFVDSNNICVRLCNDCKERGCNCTTEVTKKGKRCSCSCR